MQEYYNEIKDAIIISEDNKILLVNKYKKSITKLSPLIIISSTIISIIFPLINYSIIISVQFILFCLLRYILVYIFARKTYIKGKCPFCSNKIIVAQASAKKCSNCSTLVFAKDTATDNV